MKLIQLTQDKTTQVDDEDYERLNKLNWYARFDGRNWYAATGSAKTNTYWGMHEMVINEPGGIIDHIDGNGLNNQRQNLRKVTQSQNTQKARARKDNPLGLRGVYWAANCNKWRASIQVNGLRLNLGLFFKVNDAISAYNAASLKHFGQHGLQNHLIADAQDVFSKVG